MAGSNQYKAGDFIAVIPGTGGIISTIAARVGCVWDTAKKYIVTHPTVQRAYEAEEQSILDVSESVVIINIKFAQQIQLATRQPVDASDAKWWLSRKGKVRGFAERQELAGPDGGKIPLELTIDWDEGAGVTRSFESASTSGAERNP